eukprot:SM011151S18758  [mRNA]  locus=s11151:44:444:+ [translate_table: standard]
MPAAGAALQAGDALLPAQDQEAELPGGADQDPSQCPLPRAQAPGNGPREFAGLGLVSEPRGMPCAACQSPDHTPVLRHCLAVH